MFFLRQERVKESEQKQLTWIEVEPLPPKKEDEEQKRNKIVQTVQVERAEKAKADAFLGWQNQEVDRQTVSNKKTTVLGASSDRALTPSLENKKSAPGKNLPQELSKLGLAMIPKTPKVEQDSPQWATPGTRPEDYVPGMTESDRTALNTKEYKFYGYFQRIRERLDNAWIPILREKLITYYHSGRHLASDMNHTTKVVVILNHKGEVKKIQIVSESGTRDLDEAAAAAFNSAGPFPNPPKNMVDESGEVKIPWDFILKT